jgi:hypothetical protein
MASSIQDRITQLKAKLRAREGQPAYVKNCEEIRKEISRLESQLDAKAALEQGE